MSYAEIKPQYYRMHQPDSPWHAGSPGWSTAPWPSFMPNPNLVGPSRLAVEGLGAYFKPVYEKPIAGLGMFPQKSTYRPVDGVGEYSRTGIGAYFKPVYEKPIAGLGMFPQKSTYRPVDGVGEYSRTGIGAYFKPVYEKPIAGLGCPCAARGVGDGADPLTTNSGALRYDVVVPVAIIGAITGLAVWVSLKK